MAIGESFESVLVAAQAGAEWAFGALYDELNPRLVRYFSSRAPREAEDLAAETWLGAAPKLIGFRGDETQFRSWIFTIAHRRLMDHWRRLHALGTEPSDPDSMLDVAAPDNPEDAVIDSSSAQAAVRRLTSVLSADQAEVVLLRLLADLDVDEVAEIVGKKPGTVRVLQHRALRKLAEEFSLEGVTQ